MDDPRNTDNAWMETTAYHFHCNNELGSEVKLRAGDDAGQATWLDINLTTEPRYGPHQSHAPKPSKISAREHNAHLSGALESSQACVDHSGKRRGVGRT